jgi:ABC-2 type transport system permease protein
MISKHDIQTTKAVFKREFFGYFNSPVAYVIIVIFLLAVMGFTFFFGRFLDGNNASLTQSFFVWLPWIFAVLGPAVGMRLWSEEHRLGTLELLMTMPVKPWQAILGKFLAAAVVWAIGLGLTMSMVATVYYLGSPDSGPILTGYLGAYFYALACLAVTSAVSAFTRSQVICFIVSVALCFAVTLMGYAPIKEAMLRWSIPESIVKLISYCSFMDHFYDMSKGVLYMRDLIYFTSVIVISLLTTHVAISSKRA